MGRWIRGFTLVEMMIVVAIIAVLAAIAIPMLQRMQNSAKVAELPVNVEGLALAQYSYWLANDGFIETCTSWAPAGSPGKKRVAWSGAEADCITTGVSWRPDGDVYGIYYTMGSGPGGVTQANCQCSHPTVANHWSFAQGQTNVDQSGSNQIYLRCQPDNDPAFTTKNEGWCRNPDTY